ncbi:uncharacterized protein LOC119688157 [Teleopsis dalmanni]|uniref:uncharacterized protein LOC119688157 n=1 Tax=Teleopsis dalmanni TaxID=139649 RepID=UPI0018CE4E63|nr:uncharacterized protein LOC119688157 [Teleopsis dalmanni]
MAKFWIVGVFCLAALLQLTMARDVAEVINNDIREHLKAYQKFLEEDDGTHKADLTKLISLTETALKEDDVDKKQLLLKDLSAQFTPEFNEFFSKKLEEYTVNDNIKDSIEFYKSLSSSAEFKEEITKTIATLEALLKETEKQKKIDGLIAVEKNFSPEFQNFLKNNALPTVNRELQKNAEFFENLLVENEGLFTNEIKELKAKAEAALGDISVDEKQVALQQITNPTNQELFQYLQKKFIELN